MRQTSTSLVASVANIDTNPHSRPISFTTAIPCATTSRLLQGTSWRVSSQEGSRVWTRAPSTCMFKKHVDVYIYTYLYIFSYIYMYTHIYKYIYTYICIHICLCKYINSSTGMALPASMPAPCITLHHARFYPRFTTEHLVFRLKGDTLGTTFETIGHFWRPKPRRLAHVKKCVHRYGFMYIPILVFIFVLYSSSYLYVYFLCRYIYIYIYIYLYI